MSKREAWFTLAMILVVLMFMAKGLFAVVFLALGVVAVIVGLCVKPS